MKNLQELINKKLEEFTRTSFHSHNCPVTMDYSIKPKDEMKKCNCLYSFAIDFLIQAMREAANGAVGAVGVERLTEETSAWFGELRDEVKEFCPYCGIKPKKLHAAIAESKKKGEEFLQNKKT